MTVTQAELDEAVAALGRGEVVGLPTETVYGIGADPFLPGATGRLFAAKRRPETTALPVLVGEAETAFELGEIDAKTSALLRAFWPGPLTVVVARRPGLALELGGDESTIGLRCPDQPVARQLLRRAGPLAVTSANLHGEAPVRSAAELEKTLGPAVSVILDDGPCQGTPSSVVSLIGQPKLLRQGAVSMEAILAVLESS
jgi:L-threonylcarbamoyladenylate synthase